MSTKTLAAAAFLSLATATASFAAPINLSFDFNDASGTFYGLDDADGISAATSLDISIGNRSWVDLDVSDAAPNAFEFLSGALTDVNFVLLGQSVLDAAGTSTFVQYGVSLDFGQIVFADAGLNNDSVFGNPDFTIAAVSAVPLPAGGLLLLSGLAAAAGLASRKKRTA